MWRKPNSSMASSPVENISSEPTRKVVMTLGMTYDTQPDAMRRAMEILREIWTEHGEDMDGDPVIAFSGYGDFSMNLLFIYYSGDIKPVTVSKCRNSWGTQGR